MPPHKQAGSTIELPDTPSFQEAFAAAKVEHSTPEGEEHAQTDGEESTGDRAEGESSEQPGDKATPARTEKAETKPATPVAKDATGLLSDEEFTALQTKHADNPTALRKALEGAFTQKTQKLAEERRSVEKLREYAPLIEAYEENPEAVIRELAKLNGLSVAEVRAEIEHAETGEGTPATDGDAQATVDAVMAEFKTNLGPELEYLADGLTPAITKLVETLTKATVEKATTPLKAAQSLLLDKAAHEQTDQVMATFAKAHPDWEQHEDALFALAQKLQPNGMTENEYLDHLWKLVTADSTPDTTALEKKIADGVKAALRKMETAAAGTETRSRTTPEGQVSHARPTDHVPDFREAYLAAKGGQRWE
jgi:hypothetical protein